jgi:hypothetical protein
MTRRISMRRVEWMTAVLVLALAAPLAAQDAGADSAAGDATHDWEFALAATDRAPGATASVLVTEADGGSEFVVVASGLPVVDSLDQEGRDVNAYTVWVVPGKDRVAESELAGVLTMTPEGSGRLEGRTPLETFGVIVTATPDGAPEKIGGVPVLTGIPVRPEAPADETVTEDGGEGAGEAMDAADAPGDAEDAVTDPTQ